MGAADEAGPRQAGDYSMSNFHYVYIIVDEATGTHFYIGCTEDLKSRLEKHNKGDVPHTAKFRPWRIKNAIAFDDREKAYAFEAYLKTHCGRAFAKRHFQDFCESPVFKGICQLFYQFVQRKSIFRLTNRYVCDKLTAHLVLSFIFYCGY